MDIGSDNASLHHHLQGILIRTVADLQVMKEKFEGGFKLYNKIFETAPQSEDVEAAQKMINGGLEVHGSLLDFIESSCQSFGVLSEVKEEDLKDIKVKQEEDQQLDDNYEPLDEDDNYEEEEEEKDEKVFFCEECDRCFSKKSQLARHNRKVHSSDKVYICKVADCGEEFADAAELRTHKKKEHNQGKTKKIKKTRDMSLYTWKCDLCPMKYSSEYSLMNHHLDKHDVENSETFYCEECDKTFKVRIHYSRHLSRTHNIKNPKIYKCDLCYMEFHLTKELRNHRLVTHPEAHSGRRKKGKKAADDNGVKVENANSDKSKIPGFGGGISEFFTGQQKMDTSDNLKAFARPLNPDDPRDNNQENNDSSMKTDNDKDHPITLSDDTNYICEICCLGFKDAALLNIHKIKKHTETQFKCQYCNKDCLARNLLEVHQRNLYNCELCGQTLCSKYNLRVHRRTLHPETIDPNPVVCDLCGFKTKGKSLLARHMTMHTGEKPFECHVCHGRFTQKGSLMEHLTLHTGERPFECDQCKKTFRIAYQLKTHYRLHTGERPFSCDMCGKTFHLNGERTKHVKKCHPVKSDVDAD